MSDSSRLRIAHVDTSLALRGGQRQLLLLARGLAERGHDQWIVCPEGSALEARARRDGFRVFSLPLHDPAHAHGIAQLRQELAATPRDILHAHDGRGQTIAWLASIGQPVRRVASRRVAFTPSRQILSRLKYGYTCHAVIAVSEFVKQLLVQAGVPPRQIEVIPDGVEIPRELPTPEMRRQAREKWRLSAEDFAVGLMGSAAPEKGLEVAIAAWPLLRESLPRAHLVIATNECGEGVGRAAKLARPSDGIHWVGPQEILADFFSGLDLSIMPSRSEGLGSAALLAMAHGLAVVAARVGGLPEIIREGESGWLVDANSPQALAQAIAVAASDMSRLGQFGANARMRAHDFSAHIMVERTEALYRQILGRGPKPSGD